MIRRTRSFTVRGSGRFPIDMLRYDTCWPATQVDVRKVESNVSHASFSRDVLEVVLVGTSKPTHRRWESFGWEVLP